MRQVLQIPDRGFQKNFLGFKFDDHDRSAAFDGLHDSREISIRTIEYADERRDTDASGSFFVLFLGRRDQRLNVAVLHGDSIAGTPVLPARPAGHQ